MIALTPWRLAAVGPTSHTMKLGHTGAVASAQSHHLCVLCCLALLISVGRLWTSCTFPRGSSYVSYLVLLFTMFQIHWLLLVTTLDRSISVRKKKKFWGWIPLSFPFPVYLTSDVFLLLTLFLSLRLVSFWWQDALLDLWHDLQGPSFSGPSLSAFPSFQIITHVWMSCTGPVPLHGLRRDARHSLGAYVCPLAPFFLCPALELLQHSLLPSDLDANPPLFFPSLLTSYSSFKAWLGCNLHVAFSVAPSLCDSLLCLGSQKCVFVFHYNLCSSRLYVLVCSFYIWKPQILAWRWEPIRFRFRCPRVPCVVLRYFTDVIKHSNSSCHFVGGLLCIKMAREMRGCDSGYLGGWSKKISNSRPARASD